ncbi:fructosamine 3 kinase related protein [Tribonema minus]|uniref:protein-ribulosamine 3-kinase n=1 Tax=Tribonema minus TaxID=303371 RepID=A0A835Z3B4_9STRA|nr:fructosamine 3 kinase related protein [Tribonema minus]
MQEAERIMEQLQADAERENVIPEGVAKYMPTTEDSDPIVAALKTVLKCTEVKGLELLDSRWNGNEAFRYDTDKGRFFVKMNRVEDVSVLMTEAVSLSALAKTQTLHCPLPLHLGRLPKVGDIGPGAFMVLEWLDLKPFGAMRSDVQSGLGDKLADLHLSRVHDDLHKGRFGFPVSNFLALTPLNNEWCDTWTELFTRRMNDQLRTLYQDKAYGRAALAKGKDGGLKEALGAVIEGIPAMLEGVEVTPVLLHGDMWIGNAGGTPEGPCCFDPASFFGHSEFDLSIMDLFAGYTDAFWAAYHAKIPRAEGFRERQRVYQLYHYLNQLNLFGDSNVALTVQRLTADILEAQQASRQPVGSSA